MKVEKEDILHIAELACLNIKEEEIEQYRKNLQDILNFANVISKVNTDYAEEVIGIKNGINVFREDIVDEFKDTEALLANAKTTSNGMFEIPKVIN